MALSPEEKERRRKDRQQTKWDESHKMIDDIDHKKCNICNSYYPSSIEHFYKNSKNNIDGLYPYCISCSKEKASEWQKDPKNYDTVISNVRNQNRRESNKLSKRINTRKRRESGYFKNFFRLNPDKSKEYQSKRKENRKHEINNEEWYYCMAYFYFSCAYCGKTWEYQFNTIKQDLHKEHLIHDGKNDLSNCIPSCRDCNSEKWEHSLNTWYNENNKKYNRVRYLRIYQWIRFDYKRFIQQNSM